MKDTIGKTKIIRDIAARTGESVNACEKIVDAYNDAILNALINEDKVVLKNFITYEVITRGERSGIDLKTGKPITYPSVKSVKCKVSRALKDAVNGKK